MVSVLGILGVLCIATSSTCKQSLVKIKVKNKKKKTYLGLETHPRLETPLCCPSLLLLSPPSLPVPTPYGSTVDRAIFVKVNGLKKNEKRNT